MHILLRAAAGLTVLAMTTIAAAPSPAGADGGAAMRYFTQPEGVAGSATPYGNNEAAGRYARVPDARIWYESYGEGRPVYVLHGGGVGSPYELGTLIDTLRAHPAGFRVIVVSTRGHGRSDIGSEPLTYEQKAQDTLAVMREVGGGPATLIGFSDGAYAACKIAAMAPSSVERVVAIGAGTLRAGYYSPAISVADLEKVDAAFIAQTRSLMPEPDRLQEFLSAYMAFWSRVNIGEETFGAIRCPVLLMTGDEDDHAPVLSVLEAHQMIPNSRLCVVPKAWHTAFLDNWPVVWAAIEPFVTARVETLTPSRKLEQNNTPTGAK